MPYEAIIQPSHRPLPDQELVFSSQSKLNSVPSTRRSGKTSGIVYYSSIFAVQGCEIAIVYPTHDECKETFLKIEMVLGQYLKPLGRDKAALVMRLITGGTIRFFSYEAFARIRGKKFHYVFCDEFQENRMDEATFWAALLPTLADYQGKAFFFGTPKKGTLLHSFSLKTDPEWQHFKMRATNNPKIAPEEIALQKKILPPMVFMQEWEGEFVDFNDNLWLYEFKPELHLEKNLPIYPDERLLLSFDFNYDPCTCLLSQKIEEKAANGGGINFIKEFSVKGGTAKLCEQIIRYLGTLHGFNAALYVTGDNSGTKQDSRGNKTDYEIIHEMLDIPYNRFIDTRWQNPLLGYSRDICNTAFYHNLIYIDSENCPILANDCGIARPKEGTDQLIKDREANKLDSFDAMRYGVNAYFKSIDDIIKYSRIVNG